jgi:hypothetical protein
LPILKKIFYLFRFFGFSWLWRRCVYTIKLRGGWFLVRTPAKKWEDLAAKDNAAKCSSGEALLLRLRADESFFFSTQDIVDARHLFIRLNAGSPRNAVQEADAVLDGCFRYFDFHRFQLGFPPDWSYNPFTESVFPRGHWSKTDDFRQGDIKGVWELNRCGFVFTLARAFSQTRQDKYAQAFWRLLEDWQENNPPNSGPNWKCGQEVSLRVMAWCFGLFVFLDHPETTPLRVSRLVQMLDASGERIAANISYAVQQKNNHGLSEAAGLWTIGVLFPELQRSKKWRTLGARLLEKQTLALFYNDGAFAQHSVVYHRLALHIWIWVLRLAEIHDVVFNPAVKSRLEQATRFLYQLHDKAGGEVPFYGLNDGSDILPLHPCGYHDFRPVLQAAHYQLFGARCCASGPWDELALWLYGLPALQAPVEKPVRENFQAREGGYYILRGDESHLFTRCARFKHRPGQADLLHVDLWWRGQNIATDAGVFSYNAPVPWDASLSETAFHNTVSVDGRGQMERLDRFIWLPWVKGTVTMERQAQHLTYWQGRHDGFQRLQAPVAYYRAIVRMPEDCWLIIDKVSSRTTHAYRLHWLFKDFSFSRQGDRSLKLHTAQGDYFVSCGEWTGQQLGSRLSRAEENSAPGWRSRYYYHREPALSLTLSCEANTALFWTMFSSKPATVSPEFYIDAGSWQVQLKLSHLQTLLQHIRLTGAFQDDMILC